MNNLNRKTKHEPDKSLYLQQSFGDFDQATARLQEAFASLEKKYESINNELDCKNLELQKVLAEKERINDYLQNILESFTTGVVVADLKGKITMMNRCAETFTGFSREGAGRKSVNALFGNEFMSDSRDSLGPMFFDGDLGKKTRLNGRILEIFGSAVKAKNGEETGKVIVLRDITKTEKLEEMVKRAEKFAAMGETAANIAHEIRNPLGSIELFASLLMKDLKDRKSRERASHIISSVRDMNHKISNLLLFASDRKPSMKKINIHDALKEIMIFSRQIIENSNILLTVNYADTDPIITGNEEMLKQVYLNLILNAVQAMTEGGDLYIETQISDGYSEERNLCDSNVKIRFMDSGCGIPAKSIKKIFDPFFTTKEKGMGLGLAIVYNIVDVHGGSIDIENNEGGGTIFTITFPIAEIRCQVSADSFPCSCVGIHTVNPQP